jgi:hypothetical protein
MTVGLVRDRGVYATIPNPRFGQTMRLLAANEAKPAREWLTLIRIFEALRGLGLSRKPANQKRCVTPARIVRRNPNCGAPTPIPVPLRIS